jgi:asparagine synthase (glutamine-hydrolysing)
MCGISCLIGVDREIRGGELAAFNDAVAHRGPDGAGVAKFAFDSDRGLSPLPDSAERCDLALAHRRLSILDLSDAGAQPMFSDDAKLALTYNGEIYNYLELRSELESAGFTFKSDCDTEVALAAYQHWGTDCFRRFNGMWAMVILDIGKRNLVVSRDRFGIKPLHHYSGDGVLAFASEIKQIATLPGFAKRANPDACVAYLVNGYEIPPETFWSGVRAFPSASFAEIPLFPEDGKFDLSPRRFWSPEDVELERRSEEEWVDGLRERFYDSVRLRLRSDVPVGTCLSGGLDSSSIFKFISELSPEEGLSAFSACFDDPFADERTHMECVVKSISTCSHVKTFPTGEGFAADFDSLLRQHDEPFGSPSIYAQRQVMKSARESGVPVLLDGQGGDELFSGYWPTYFLFLNHLRSRGDVFSFLAHFAGAALPGGNGLLISESLRGFREYRKRSAMKFPYAIDKAKAAGFAEYASNYSKVMRMSPEEYRIHELIDLRLPRLLKWEDRNSMAFSIESRVPFLDVNLVEFILSMPCSMNMRSGWTKRIFRKAMNDKLPRSVCWRKDKKGFETPQDKWLRKGAMFKRLESWAAGMEHPVSDYITTPFDEIAATIDSGSYDTTSMFRLFCLDEWLRSP